VDDGEVAFAGIARQAQLIRDGELSSRELTDLYLARIERLDPRLNSCSVVLAETARAEAEKADRRQAAGEHRPLNGVALAIKDVEDVQGVVTAYGTGAFDRPAAADGELVRRLRAAGAVIIAKTTLPELAICGFTESERWGITRNPWDLERSPGGSSGGSASAVAAGLVGAASASDGAGSVRIPAASCGLFGLKVQRGRLPLAPPDHWYGLSVHGCVTRTVLDTALFLDATVNREGEAGAPAPPDTSYAEIARPPAERLRIAFSERPARVLAPPLITDDVRRALSETEELLGSLGHRVHREDPRYGLAGNNLAPRYLRGIRDEIATVEHPERLESRTQGFGRLGAAYPAWLARRAVARGQRDARRINAIFERCDVLVTPTVGEPAIEVGRWASQGAMRTLLGMSRTYAFTPVWNHTGQPAAAVPAGFTEAGLPLSVTLVGRPGDEATLLSLAAEIEAERPWADRRPPV
jgi:amidase